MKHYHAILVLALFLLTGCAEGEMAPQSTPTELPEALQFYVAIGQAEATKGAIEATQVWLYGQVTATAEIRDITATAAAAQMTRQAHEDEKQATQAAFAAEQKATERAWNATVAAGNAMSTQYANATATAYPMTQVAMTQHAIATATAYPSTATAAAALGNAQATAAWGEAESVDLAIKRQKSVNMVMAWVPWIAGILAVAALIYAIAKWSRVRVVAKDAFGSSPVLIQDGMIVDPDRMPGPILRRLPDGSIEGGQADSKITERAQTVQMIRALPAGRVEPPPFMFNGDQKQPVIEVLPVETVRSWVDDVSRQADEQEV